MTTKETSSQLSEEAILAALSTVIEPELHRDLVSLNMVRDVEIDAGTVNFSSADEPPQMIERIAGLVAVKK